MRIACLSDTHGAPPDLLLDGCDYLLHAGDFYNELGTFDYKCRNKFACLQKWIDQLKIRAFSVRGNHDCEDPLGWFIQHQVGWSQNVRSGDVEQLASNLFLIAINWTGEKYYDLPSESDLSKCIIKAMDSACKKMKDGDLSIVFSHFPGNFYGKVHPGFTFDCICKLVDAVRPLAVVSGHVHHIAHKFVDYNGTLIVPAGHKGCYLNIEADSVSVSLP